MRRSCLLGLTLFLLLGQSKFQHVLRETSGNEILYCRKENMGFVHKTSPVVPWFPHPARFQGQALGKTGRGGGENVDYFPGHVLY